MSVVNAVLQEERLNRSISLFKLKTVSTYDKLQLPITISYKHLKNLVPLSIGGVCANPVHSRERPCLCRGCINACAPRRPKSPNIWRRKKFSFSNNFWKRRCCAVINVKFSCGKVEIVFSIFKIHTLMHIFVLLRAFEQSIVVTHRDR